MPLAVALRPAPPRPRWYDVGLVALALAVDLALWGGDGSLRFGGRVPFAVVLVVGVLAFGVLTLRGRWPRAAFGVLWLYSVVVAAAIPFYQPFTGLLIALYHLARHAPLRHSVPALVAVAVPFGINTVNSITLNSAMPVEGVGVGAFWALVTAVVWEVGRVGYRAAETAALRERHRATEAALAVQQERLRLARELHDSVANAVSAVIMQAAGARHVATDADERLSGALGSIESSASQAMRELRRLLGLLHDAADGPDDLATGASLADLEQLVVTTRSCDLGVEVAEEGPRRALDPSVDHAAYRVVQESLANAVKHGGPGGSATVTLGWGADALTITVRSTPGGPGAAAPPLGRPPTHALGSGLGLAGLTERVGALGGRLVAGRPPRGTAFEVSAELPYRPLPTG